VQVSGALEKGRREGSGPRRVGSAIMTVGETRVLEKDRKKV